MAYSAEICDLIALYSRGEGSSIFPAKQYDSELNIKVTLERHVAITPTVYIFVLSYSSDHDEIFKCHTFAHFIFHGIHDPPSQPGHWNGVQIPIAEDCKVTKKFTPIFLDHGRREVHFLIRIYRRSERYPDGGRFTRFLESLKPRDQLTISPSSTKIELLGEGVIRNFKGVIPFKTLNIIAGGTGITPYIRFLIWNQTSKINLLFYNKTLEEILLKPLLDSLQSKGLLRIKYIVTSEAPTIISGYKPDEAANVFFGKMRREDIENFFDKEDSCTLFCGPPGMNVWARTLLAELGFD